MSTWSKSLGLVALVGLAALFGARTAQAAPTLSVVGGTPVVFAPGEAVKLVTLIWNLGGTASATLTVVDAGQNPLPGFPKTVNTPPGSGTEMILLTSGQSYTAKLLASNNPASVLFSLAIPTKVAAPTLTASQTTVEFDGANSTKNITLSYTLDGLASAQLTAVNAANQPASGYPQTVSGPSGMKTLTVACCTTYTASLVYPPTGVTLKTVQITTKLGTPPITVDPGVLGTLCATMLCVTDISVAPHSTYAKVTVTTSKPAKVSYAVSHNPPAPNKSLSPVLDQKVGDVYVTHSGANLENLEGGKDAWLLVTAVDQNGNQVSHNKQFKTPQRQIKVAIYKIIVHNDSDPNSSGEFWFGLWVDGQGPVKFINYDITDGQEVILNLSKTIIKNTGTTVTVELLGVDEDMAGHCFAFFGADVAAIKDCGEWALAQKTVDIPMIAGAFDLSVNADSVQFTATGFVYVSDA